jgi:phosphotransacetylase
MQAEPGQRETAGDGGACAVHEAGEHYRPVVAAAREHERITTALVHPCYGRSIEGALEAARLGLIRPVLVGPKDKIRRAATEAGCTLDGLELVDAPHSHAAAQQAVALAREGKVQALMKGALHTDELMAAVIDRATGLRTERRMSHVFALDVPTYAKPLFITDAAINIEPTLLEKRDIVQNAIDLAHALGIESPKIAVLSAIETVNPDIASTIDAAALCKMLDRGQITGARIDGPLAFDNAISREAAESKGIRSEVAGDADILVVPDLVSGNMLVKQLVYLSGAIAAGIVLGARVPVMLTSRADDLEARLASAALAVLHVHHRARPRAPL